MFKYITQQSCSSIYSRILKNKLPYRICTISRYKSDSVEQIVNKEEPTYISPNQQRSYALNNKTTFVEKLVNTSPAFMQPYMKIARIHKPIGTWLLYWPCTWSIAMAASPGCLPDFYLLTLFGAGALVMRGAGCTINDMWDRDIDKKVVRTFDRPLVNGSMSLQQALVFLAGQLSVGLVILLQLNWYSIFLGASSLAFVATYPLMKRITYWPQLMLGMTFNWGILLGYSAVHGYVDLSVCLPMYISAICWTIIYDTIYAHQDIADDILLGMKSTAIKFKENTKYWLSGFSFFMISGLCTTGIIAEQTWPYFSALALVASHLAWQIHSLKIDVPKDCASKFTSNHHVGFLLFCGIVLGNLLKKEKNEEVDNTIEDKI